MHVIRETNLTTMAERNIIVCVQLFHRQAMRSMACAAWDTHHHTMNTSPSVWWTNSPDCTPPRQSHVVSC